MLRVPGSSSHHRHHRRVVGFVAVALLALVASFAARPTPPAAATAGDEAAFVAALNEVRAGQGLPAFTVNSQLVTLARSHAQVMADAGEIFHADPISAGFTGSWSKLGENVGVGASVPVLVDAFVASPGHYANIIDPGFTQIGVGVVRKDGALYTTHRFLQPPGAPTTTTTAPAPTTTAPAPATTAPPPPTTAPQPTPTTTTIAPLAPPAVLPARLIEVVGLLELVGT